MYEYMIYEHRPNESLLTTDNDEGLIKAQQEEIPGERNSYAYLMESSSIEYITERICNVTQVGELIDDKHYAIGTRKGTFVI